MQRSLFLLTVMISGQVFFSSCHLYEYHLIEEEKTWDDAQKFCREKYTDLATVWNMADCMRLKELMREKKVMAAWIGLRSEQGDSGKWHWSLPNIPGVEFVDLKPHCRHNEPNDHGRNFENCVEIFEGKLNDQKFGFVCFKGTGVEGISGLNELEKFYKTPKSKRLRIGLFSDPWSYGSSSGGSSSGGSSSGGSRSGESSSGGSRSGGSRSGGSSSGESSSGGSRSGGSSSGESSSGGSRSSGSSSGGSRYRRSSSSFRNLGLNDGVDKTECVTVSGSSGKWSSGDCSTKKPFVCYDDKVILVRENLTWDEALDHCREHHHDLVTITNLHQQRWVQARAKRATTSHVWLGLRYSCYMDLWFWVSDHLVCYSNWKNGASEDLRDYAAAMETAGGNKWVKKNDTDKLNVICARKSET